MAMLPEQRDAVNGRSPTNRRRWQRLARKLEREAPGQIRVFYEAGPCGYALQRQLTTTWIAARSWHRRWFRSSRATGSRRAGGTRGSWLELGRAGLLTEVRPRRAAQEAVRDLARARDDARKISCGVGTDWASCCCGGGWHSAEEALDAGHRPWVESLHLGRAAERAFVQDDLLAIRAPDVAVGSDAELGGDSQRGAVSGVRGPPVVLPGHRDGDRDADLAELHDLRRFASARG